MVKILVSDPISEEGLEILRAEPDFQVEVKTGLEPPELANIIGSYDALLVRSGTQVTQEVLKRADRLKVIGRAGTGLDNVDAEAASKRGIIVMNTPGGNTISTAEHTMSLILSLSRNIPQADASVKQGKWERGKFMGSELYGKILGIVGLGRIGSEVARRAQGFGMHVIAYDPYLVSEKAREIDVKLVEFDELLASADVISFHTPLTHDTKHLLNAKTLARVKPGVRIVNCARGGVVDEQALYEAIKAGQVAGAALDVYEQEPPKDSPLATLPQVVLTPHLGASTEEAQVNVAIEIAKQVRDALTGRGVRNAVNVPYVDPEILKVIDPYLKLAERLGSLASQLVEGRFTEVYVRYLGDVVHLDVVPITIAAVKGLLTPAVGENVNYVNASFLAKDRGIKVIESKASVGEEFTNLIVLELVTERGRRSVAGTIFTRDEPRLVKIDKFHVEAIPAGDMLVISNQDRPGVIGSIGTILGRHKINIAGMTFGRSTMGGEAITVLNLDTPASAAVLDELRRAPHIQDVKTIKL